MSEPKRKRSKVQCQRGASASKRVKKRKKKQTTLNALYVFDEGCLERPTPMDFNCGFSSLSQAHLYRLRDEETGRDESNSSGLVLAPAPQIPAPDDDHERMVMVECQSSEEDDQSTKRTSRMMPTKDKRAEQKGSLTRPKAKQRKRAPPNFMNIPREIRDRIYRHILVAEKPIIVHGGWKLVYKRDRPSLSTGILGCCRQVHEESRRVLYGMNTFHYLLRDASTSVKNLHRLATDDRIRGDSDYGDDSGSEYDEEPPERLARQNKKSMEWNIKVEKYLPLFRHIIVEAEHNRYFEDTQESMAKAIKAFAKPRLAGKPNKFNIHTLTVRLTPLWDPLGGEDEEGTFTFLNFFQPGAPVLKAIQAITCQFTQIDILTRYMVNKGSSKGPDKNSYRLRIDRRHERIGILSESSQPEKGRLGQDWWAKDQVMRIVRANRAAQSVRAVNDIGRHIEEKCIQRNFEADTTLDLCPDSGEFGF